MRLVRPVLWLRLEAPLRAVRRRQHRGPVHGVPPLRPILRMSLKCRLLLYWSRADPCPA